MKIEVVGGGPAGLWFAILVKRRRPAWAVRVHEQNPAGATYGFGVVLSDAGREWSGAPRRPRSTGSRAGWNIGRT